MVKKSHSTIYGKGRELVQEKKRRILEGEKNGTDYTGTDLLSHLCMCTYMSSLIIKLKRPSEIQHVYGLVARTAHFGR